MDLHNYACGIGLRDALAQPAHFTDERTVSETQWVKCLGAQGQRQAPGSWSSLSYKALLKLHVLQ